jgi:cytoskeletal protein RodZ
VTIGGTLAQARRDAGLTTADVSARTRIREGVIRAIEGDDFAPCGGDFYARGHIRAIGQVVGIDPGPLVAEYDAAHGGAPAAAAVPSLEQHAPIRFKERRRPNWSLAMAFAIVVVLGYGIFHAVTSHTPTAEPRADRVAPARSAPSKAATRGRIVIPGSTDIVALRIRAKDTCWLQVTTASGRTLYAGVLRPGQTEGWRAKKEIRLAMGNAGGVSLIVNGKNVGVPGRYGDVVSLAVRPTGVKSAA